MKSIVMSLVLAASISAIASEYVTEKVCDNNNEAGIEMCRQVTYLKRAPSAPVAYTCTQLIGEANLVVACPTSYKIPAILISINNWFKAHGATERELQDPNFGY